MLYKTEILRELLTYSTPSLVVGIPQDLVAATMGFINPSLGYLQTNRYASASARVYHYEKTILDQRQRFPELVLHEEPCSISYPSFLGSVSSLLIPPIHAAFL